MKPRAWNPFTFKGVAAFSWSGWIRLWVAQWLAALLLGGSFYMTLTKAWGPVLHEALRNLPDEPGIASLENRNLHWSNLKSPEILAGNEFLSLVVDPQDHPALPGAASDVRVVFRKNHMEIRAALLGQIDISYHEEWNLNLTREDVFAWWGAWGVGWVVGMIAGGLILLWTTWMALGLFYSPPGWALAYFWDRDTGPFGSWRLATASLLPGGIFLGLAFTAYGLGWIPWLVLWGAFLAHWGIGWVYWIGAIRRIPYLKYAAEEHGNPFALTAR